MPPACLPVAAAAGLVSAGRRSTFLWSACRWSVVARGGVAAGERWCAPEEGRPKSVPSAWVMATWQRCPQSVSRERTQERANIHKRKEKAAAVGRGHSTGPNPSSGHRAPADRAFSHQRLGGHHRRRATSAAPTAARAAATAGPLHPPPERQEHAHGRQAAERKKSKLRGLEHARARQEATNATVTLQEAQNVTRSTSTLQQPPLLPRPPSPPSAPDPCRGSPTREI